MGGRGGGGEMGAYGIARVLTFFPSGTSGIWILKRSIAVSFSPGVCGFSSCLMHVSIFKTLGGVYMTPGQLSRRGEITPVPSHGSTFVYMITPQKVMPARIAPA